MLAYDLAEAPHPWATAVLLHPHPDMGGDRHNNVIATLFDALPLEGVSALRFDFTSSNLDTAAQETCEALDLVEGDPRFLVAYSFGGGIAATVTDPRIAGWFLVAPALTMVEPTIGHDERPKAIAAAEHDRFFSPARLQMATADWIATEHTTVSGADHFFTGRTDEVTRQVIDFIKRVAQ